MDSQKIGIAVSMFLSATLGWATSAAATNIEIWDSQAVDHIGLCDLRTGGTASSCRSGAFVQLINDLPADPTDSVFATGKFNGTAPTNQTFTTAFNNWNDANGDLWTLTDGGGLDVTLDVKFTAVAGKDFGGISAISIHFTDYNPGPNDPAESQFVWIQGLYINYRPLGGSGITPPLVTLDTYSFSNGGAAGWGGIGSFSLACTDIPGSTPAAGNTAPSTFGVNNPTALDNSIPQQSVYQPYCDPIYPFQYETQDFFDAPMGKWPDASFRAIALPATITYVADDQGKITQRKLIVYDGVNWGFDLSVPEPATITLFGAALIGLMSVRRFRRRCRA